MKILLLEDNSTDAELTIRYLKKTWTKCSVEHISSVKEAHEILEEKPEFDIALLDMQLPDGNGLDILMEIRQKKLDMAVAMLTGSGDEEVAVAALKAGADDYTVKKPGYTAKVPQSVELALINHKQHRERESIIIHVLYIEHNAADVDFTKRHLMRYAPYIRLSNVPNGKKALELLPGPGIPPEKWDYHLILLDYRLPGMNALEIIKEIRQERQLDIPILIVTGHGNEDVAVQALKIGASDYLVKRENYLTRLPSLITGAYQNCELIRKQKALKESESKYRLLAENSGDMIFTLDFELNYTYVSPAIKVLRGFTPEEVMQKKISEAMTPASLKIVKSTVDRVFPKIKSGDISLKPMVVELEMYKKDGSTGWFEVKVSVSTDSQGTPNGILGVSRDVSKRKAFQDELRKLSRAVTQSPDSIIITNKDGRIEYVNPKFTQITGYNFDEVLGKNPRILNSGEHSKSHYKELWDNILDGKDWYGEFRNKKKNGDLYWESASISPLVNDEGEITHFVAVKEDITERKQTDELLKYHLELQQILLKIASKYINIEADELEDSIVESLAEMGKFAGADRVYIFDYNWDKQITTNTYEWCDKGINSQIANLKNVPMEMTPEWIETHKKGKAIFVADVSALLFDSGLRAVLEPQEIKSIISIPMMDGKTCIGFVGFDWVKKQHEYSEEEKLLLSLYAQMLVNVKNRINLENSLITEKENAQAADRLKTAFLNNISHEVRTPLNGILGFGQMMAETNLSAEQKKMYFKILKKSSDRLISTITSIMDISLLVSGNMQVSKKPTSLNYLLINIYESFEDSFNDKGLDFKLRINKNIADLKFETDEEILKKIFSHLIDNAFKFTKDGSVQFGAEQKNNTVEFFVEDSGIGIDTEMQKSVFGYFIQEDSRIARGYEGSGLGLSIAKGLVRLLGGELLLKSEKGVGTTVSFILPLSDDKDNHEDGENLESGFGGNVVLIAEDDYVNCLYLEAILARAGIQFVSVNDGGQAVDKCRENYEIGLVLMDIKMPVMDGFEATRKIKSFKPKLPVIAITAHALQGDREQVMQAGCDDYLSKPINKELLLSKVKYYLKMEKKEKNF